MLRPALDDDMIESGMLELTTERHPARTAPPDRIAGRKFRDRIYPGGGGQAPSTMGFSGERASLPGLILS
jgi:hypothetical protein